MPFAEILNERDPRRMLRIKTMIPDWVPGEVYETNIKFKLISMDESGMDVEVTLTDLELNKQEDRDNSEGSRKPMQVVPSPS